MAITKITLDTRELDRREKQAPGTADKVLGKLSLDCVADMQQSMSPNSPSAPGQPPAIDTGNLVNSLRAERVQERVWRLHDGTPYGAALEFGVPANGLAARPFFEPAIRRMAKRAPAALKVVVK